MSICQRFSTQLRVFNWLAVGLLISCPTVAGAESPHIIVIMADDLGYGDVGCYGATALDTPGIDRMAREGQRFTNGYCSASTCTPTRYSFLTGTYAFRVAGTGIAAPNAAALIPAGMPTLPSLLKEAGYRTAVIGKWHLGLGDPEPDWNGRLVPGPLEIGFDHALLLPTTNDRVPQVYVSDRHVLNLDPADPLWVGNTQPAGDHPTGITHRDSLAMDWSHGHNGTIHNGISRIGFYTGGHAARFRDQDLADRWVEESKAWIGADSDQPFFLFFASHDLHVPRVVHERFVGKSGLGPRGDAIVELDWCVGELLDTLDQLNLAENTLVVFCSDNGPVLDDGYQDDAVEKLGDHQPAGPYSGGKYSVLEGGTRTPLITRWLGRIPAGENDAMVCTVDLAASLAGLVATPLADHAFLDSVNVLPAFLGQSDAVGRANLIQQDNGASGRFGYREGNWKLIKQPRGKAGKQKTAAVVSDPKRPAPFDPKDVWSLFDLANDPGETINVIDEYPGIADAMRTRLEQSIARGYSRPELMTTPPAALMSPR